MRKAGDRSIWESLFSGLGWSWTKLWSYGKTLKYLFLGLFSSRVANLKVAVGDISLMEANSSLSPCTMYDFHDFGLTWKCQKIFPYGCTITSKTKINVDFSLWGKQCICPVKMRPNSWKSHIVPCWPRDSTWCMNWSRVISLSKSSLKVSWSSTSPGWFESEESWWLKDNGSQLFRVYTDWKKCANNNQFS